MRAGNGQRRDGVSEGVFSQPGRLPDGKPAKAGAGHAKEGTGSPEDGAGGEEGEADRAERGTGSPKEGAGSEEGEQIELREETGSPVDGAGSEEGELGIDKKRHVTRMEINLYRDAACAIFAPGNRTRAVAVAVAAQSPFL